MNLEELCRAEGLDAEELARTVEWARGRAEEIAASVMADAELGAILDAAWEDESGLNRLPQAPPPEASAAPAEAAELSERPAFEEEEEGSVDVGALLDDVIAESEQRETPTEDEAPAEEVAAAAAVAEPTGFDDDDEEITAPQDVGPSNLRDMLAGGARPALARTPMGVESSAPATKEMTEEIEVDEIELIDEDDLELVDDEEEAAAPAAASGELPEWQQALSSAQMGGGAQADHDSGLLRLPKRPEPSTAREGKPPSEASSVDVDLSDLD